MERKLALQLLREGREPSAAQLSKAASEGWQAAKNREGLASCPYKGNWHPLGDAWIDAYWEFKETRI